MRPMTRAMVGTFTACQASETGHVAGCHEGDDPEQGDAGAVEGEARDLAEQQGGVDGDEDGQDRGVHARPSSCDA